MPSTDCKIFILTGEVHSGKSRTLGRFLTDKKREGKVVKGLLNPRIDQEKWFMDLSSEDVFSAEKMTNGDRPIKIGQYTFSTNAFERAKSILTEKPKEPCDFFVIDELGKLELDGHGLEPSISTILEKLPTAKIRNLIIVVRDFLVEKSISQFNLDSAKIIKQTDLNETEWN
jgi:nucleoside-triphosphatase THEP1